MKKTLLLAGMLSATVSFAQERFFTFEEVKGSLGLPATKDGSLATATINGKKAVLVSGRIRNLSSKTSLYLLENGKFVEDKNAKFQGIADGQSIFVDVDRDGDSDVVLIGARFDVPYFKVYENNGGAFTEKTGMALEGLSYASVDAGDYNNDGFPDLLVTGSDRNGNKHTLIYDNQNGNFVKNTSHSFTGIMQGDAKFFHANGDDRLDIVLAGKKNDYGTVEVYTQTSAGTFTKTQDFYSEDYGYEGANIAVGDLSGNGQGYSDFIVIGRGYTDGAYVFNNIKEEEDEGRFIVEYNFGKLYAGGGKSAATIVDLDKDGKNDIVFAGGSEDDESAEIYIYKNVKDGAYLEDFKRDESLNLAFGQEGSVLAFDYDEDGDMDLFVTGMDAEGGENEARILKNNTPSLSNKEIATKTSVELYPNPVSNEFRLKGIDKVSQISIYDMSGRLVKTFASQSQYDISGLAKGNYIVLVKGATTHQFKIVKK